MHKSYRLRSSHTVTALLCMAVTGLLAAFSLYLFLHDESYSTTAFAIGETLWVVFFLLGVYLLLSARWNWLERDGDSLVQHRRASSERFALGAATVRWELFPRGGRIVLEEEGRKLSVVLDNYRPDERAELINWIVKAAPGARSEKSGWEAFRAKYADWHPGQKSASPNTNDR